MVCSRRDADQQCRVPQELSETHYSPAKNSWVNKAQVVADVSRTAGGLPDTCSPVGTGGQTGCFMQSGRAAAADRRQGKRAEESLPVGCASWRDRGCKYVLLSVVYVRIKKKKSKTQTNK